MIPAPIKANEDERLAALQRYKILYTAAEAEFDDFTRLAAQLCDTPIARISLVDTDREWFKSQLGLAAQETPRDISFCGHAIHGQGLFEVPDALNDVRFQDNPMVTGPLGIRFYAGVPLITPDGHGIGTLCVLDTKPRLLSAQQRDALLTFGKQLLWKLELRLSLQREQQLNEKLTRLTIFQKTLFDSAAMAVISTTIDGVITTFNPAAEQMLGYRAEELIGKQNPGLFHDGAEVVARAAELSEELQRTVEPGFEVFVIKLITQASETREWTYCCKDGARIPVILTISAVRESNGNLIGYLGLARDISDRRRAEKLKSEFVATVSHELRTPLTSITGALGLITGGALGEIPAKVKALLDIAYKNSKGLTRLINDLLDIEKLANSKLHFDLQPHALLDLLVQSIENNRPFGDQHQVRFELGLCSAALQVNVDAMRLQQVMANLLSNAAKFSPPGGVVNIDVQERGTAVRVTVTDHGCGVPMEFRDHIFEKFSQADSSDSRQLGGTGLGLAISKELIEQMHGTIDFESQEGDGASFYFELPRWQI